MPSRAYTECLDSMYRMRRFGIILGLSTIANILNGLGNPHRTFPSIHIAGTNGKGSVASAIAAILQEAGYRVGLYTSPHLVRFNERICINAQPIDNDAVVASWQAVRSVHHGDREPTFFEFSTAMAFYEFARRQVDFAVIETGMGGRMDATNIITPMLSIITNISLEHKIYLGRTIAAITAEKAGIIKPAVPVVTGVTQPSAKTVVRRVAAQQSAPLYIQGRDFQVRRSGPERFAYRGIDHRWPGMRTALMGAHQMANAALTLAACELLMRSRVALSADHVQSGLARNRWPGRLEVVSHNPYVILDGAHNLMAARGLGRFLRQALTGRRITLVLGILDDKPYRTILKDLVPACSRLIITRPKIDRALAPEILEAAAAAMISDLQTIADVGAAVRYAIETSGPDDAVCVAGSLYVVGEAKAALENSDSLFQV